MADKRESLLWIDYIRATAALGVVMVHVAADVITEWGAIPAGHWWIANLFDSLTRGCVPIFIMVSGALLLPVQESPGSFFRKRFQRIFVPFIVWTAVYLLWKKAFYRPELGLSLSMEMVLNANVWLHLWFFYILIGLYLMTPVFRIFTANAGRKEMGYLLALWFALGSLLPFLDNIMNLFGVHCFHTNFSVAIAQGFIGYFILGAFIMKYSDRRWVRPAAIAWSACFLICFLGTGWLTARFGTFKEAFYDNLAPNIVFYCASFFVLVKYVITSAQGKMPVSCKDLITRLAKASFGIYLIHPLLIDILEKGRVGLVLKSDHGHPLITIPAISFGVYFISFAVVRAIQRIPYLKRIV